MRYPEGHVLYRKLAQDLPRIVRGEGCWLVDDTGKRYLDASGGAFVVNLGHGVAEIGDAMAAQAKRLGYVSGMAFTHDPVETLARELAALCPGDLDRCFFLSSGSEAVEAALKLARQYWVESGEPKKDTIIALAPGYHGNTLLAMSASARAPYPAVFGDWMVRVERVPAPQTYRCACGGREPLCPACGGDALEQAILRAGPDRVAAFIAEPVGGASTGAAVPPGPWFRRVRELCDRHRVLFIADEVLCGTGRTGTFTAISAFGVVPDLLTLGKGLGGGYAPLSALVAPRRIVDVIARGSGSFLHAQTFAHHPVLCAGGLATLAWLRDHRLIERCAEMAPRFHEALGALRGLPHVGDVRGRGLLAGVEFVADRATKRPFPRATKFAERFTAEARAAGLVVWPNTGHVDGVDGDLVALAPPFIITEAEIAELVRRFGAALTATVATLSS